MPCQVTYQPSPMPHPDTYWRCLLFSNSPASSCNYSFSYTCSGILLTYTYNSRPSLPFQLLKTYPLYYPQERATMTHGEETALEIKSEIKKEPRRGFWQ